DIALVEERGLDAEIYGPAADIGSRSRDGFLHHVTQIARYRHAALAGHHHAFDRQQLAADLSPGKPRNHADLIVSLGHTEAIPRHPEIVGQVVLGDLHGLLLRLQDLGHRLAPELHQLAFKTAHARFAGIGLDDAAYGVLRHRE